MDLKNKLVTFTDYDLHHDGILRFSAANRMLTPKLLRASWHQAPRRFVKTHQEHFHDVYHVILVEEGQGTFSYRARPHAVKKGALFLIGPGETHALETLHGETTVFSEVTFQLLDDQRKIVALPFLEWLQAWAGFPGLTHAPGTKLAPDFHRELSAALSRLVGSRLYKGQEHPFFLHSLWQSTMEILVRALTADATSTHRDDPVEIARHLIRMESPHPVRIPEIARKVGLSANYLTRIFKERYRITPIRYHQQMRIEAVKTLLLYTRDPLKSIAAQTGFSDEYYLARLFREVEGIPPGKFRSKPEIERPPPRRTEKRHGSYPHRQKT